MRLARSLSVPALLLLGGALDPSLSAQEAARAVPGDRWHASADLVLEGTQGGRRLTRLVDGGSGASLSLAGWTALTHPGGPVALLATRTEDPVRRLRLLGPGLETLAEVDVPASRKVVPGQTGFALIPADEHQRGSSFDVTVLDERGRTLGETRRAGRVLVGLRALADGGFAARCVDSQGLGHVSFLDARGQERFEVDSGSARLPLAAAAPDGERFAVITFPDGEEARLVLHGAGGERLAAFEVPLSHRLVFSPDGTKLALQGRRQVSLVDVVGGSVVWTQDTPGPLALGAAVQFTGVGEALHVVTQERGRLRLFTVSTLGAGPTLASAPAAARVPAEALHVLALREDSSGSPQVVTHQGRFTLER